VRAFQRKLCLRIHFYTGWQFFLFLLCPLRHRHDWRCQRFSRFPDANTNSNGHAHRYCHSNRDGYAKCDSNRNVGAKWDANSNCNGDRYTSPKNSTDANTSPSPNTSAASVGS
jgi:hypothetical protein